jgi:rod shape determining protein RodA
MFETALNERPQRVDWMLLAALVGLMALGAAFIHSARLATEATLGSQWYQQFFFKQIIWYVLGLTAMSLVCMVDYRVLSRWSFVFYWLAIASLVTVLVLGKTVYGARRWFDLGLFNLQPSEFGKLAFILAMAHFLARPEEELRRSRVFFQAIGLTLLPFVLILREPDLGSALVLLPVGLVMLFVGGAPRRFLWRLVAVVGSLVVLLLVDILFAPPNWRIKLEDYQSRRLWVYFGRNFQAYAPPDATATERLRLRTQQRNDSYNVEQALISVGSGGLTGKGWRQGTQNALGYLPRAVAHNDFIFSVLAEESGFVGSVVVITLYGVILFTGLRIAGQARDRLGKLVAVGVVTLLFSHVFINIGMNIRLMPVTGVPLPLLSYGGSSVLCSLIAAGLLQNVQMYRKTY